MGPSEPEIFRGDFLAKLDHMCPKRKILPRGNYYCACRGYFANLLFSPVFSIVCFCLYIFLFDLFFFACLSAFTQVGPSVPKIFRDDLFSRESSVPEILRGDVSPKWDHLCPRYLEMIFSREWDHLCARYLEMIFSREWDHLCPRYLETIFFTRMGPSVPKIFRDDFFHANGSICARDT